MNSAPDLKSKLSALRDKANELLHFHEIYDIMSYGWENEDTPDSEYVGHAMWQTQPPFEPDWSALFEGKPVAYQPTTRDEYLVLNGEDFTGTMIFARRSLGMALLYASVAENDDVTGENLEFWQEYATTMQWLNIASDRIRDYFIMARFGKKTAKAFNKAYRQQHAAGTPDPVYSTPFEEALVGAHKDYLDSLRRLRDIAVAVQGHRTERNHIVHDVATHTAQRSLWILRNQRQRTTGNAEPPQTLAIAPAVEKLKTWYVELVQMSSLVFEIEYFSRQKRTS